MLFLYAAIESVLKHEDLRNNTPASVSKDRVFYSGLGQTFNGLLGRVAAGVMLASSKSSLCSPTHRTAC